MTDTNKTQNHPLRVLHTSDWHLGRMLYGRQRYDEFKQFFSWLHSTIIEQKIDILLVAGDIFHTTTPSNQAQQLYYSFLCKVAASSCRHLVVTAGNHDSPTFLDAPRELLRTLNIHVIASLPEAIEDEVLLLRNRAGETEAIICAVPFLRDRDIRVAIPGQDMVDREEQLINGIGRHYLAVCEEAVRQQKKEEHKLAKKQKIPIIGMGHLLAAGGSTVQGDGVRENLYVGSLISVGADIFPDLIDYLALGHLHSPQKVSGLETRRYSGAPLTMGFAEAGRKKSINVVDFSQTGVEVELRNVPVFQNISCIEGDWPHIEGQLALLITDDVHCWLEIIYQGKEILPDLRQRLDEMVLDSKLEILRIRNQRITEQILSPQSEGETLADLGHAQVFERCLDGQDIIGEQRLELIAAYNEIVTSLEQE